MKTINETTDYSMFRTFEGQRNVNEAHVRELMKEISEKGYICAPIRVTPNMEVFDGQHTLEALKRLGMPVEYIVETNVNITPEIVRSINNKQMKWKMRDYTTSFANTGCEAYALILELAERYGVNEGTVLRSANRQQTNGSGSYSYKSGTIEFTARDYMKANRRLPIYKKVKEALSKHRGSGIAITSGIFFLLDQGYNVDKIIQAEETYGNPKVRFDTLFGFLEYIEETYNRKKPSQSRIYPSEEFKKTGAYKVAYK